ncbi:hypothetical protein MUK42_11941 [Musa troglodytarum]|uniref:Uncharacterized protein n=1 Tax=Musa troglodytarum TaxID=320322 RepID=A0A9E7JXS6_9LILI|nr:hypothetical protein MUK42_11941 [Musa troglodytarum]
MYDSVGEGNGGAGEHFPAVDNCCLPLEYDTWMEDVKDGEPVAGAETQSNGSTSIWGLPASVSPCPRPFAGDKSMVQLVHDLRSSCQQIRRRRTGTQRSGYKLKKGDERCKLKWKKS